MNSLMHEEATNVCVGVLLMSVQEKNTCVVITQDGHRVDLVTGKDESTKSFSFDLVVTDDNIKGLYPDFLQPLVQSVLKGYNGALLIHGASTERSRALIDQNIRQVEILISLLKGKAEEKEDSFIALSFIQFYPDGTAIDVLGSNPGKLKPVIHPVIGRIAGGVSEVCVSAPEEAYNLFETCRDRVRSSPGGLSCRCSTLLSVAVEWRVQSEVCRSRLQLFSLEGGASRTELRGVSPLVKALAEIQTEDSPEDKLLSFLLKDALSGNSQTALLCCLHPQGVLDNETPNALTLAEKVRTLVTKPTVLHWCPRATEEKIRDKMAALRTEMMSEGTSELHSTYKLAQLNHELQVVKSQSWERRREQSNKIKEKQKNHRSASSTSLSGDMGDVPETVRHLQDQLRFEMHKHIHDGKADAKMVQEQVERIHQLRGALREETLKHSTAIDKPDISSQSQLEYNKAQERRRRVQEDHGRLIQEEVENMERELAQEQPLTEGPQRELQVLSKERRILVLQLEALRTELQQTEQDLIQQHNTHQAEMHCLREESLQVFRVFRDVCEEQRRMSEERYRTVLLEAVQDAVYLSAQNQQLQVDNKELTKALADLKDTLAAQGESKVK
ncbi:osmotic avoidance abnormal protein 3 [Periophthalmus magnuspinnatus]|uniref:osmotic avoidance abnormal protein 3 n=1 Tax=Periophthalmus magnuspinnatus TaxID=409849 RepID=UPI0024368BDC|nr:osmotic avoidance abnormal protein 3 [Periophthalmus magnuspinnatus]